MTSITVDATSISEPRDPAKHFSWRDSKAFVYIQAFAGLGLLWGLVTLRWWLLAWAVALWWIRSHFVTGFYHRYLSHNTYRLNRFWETVFAFIGTTAAQKGPLWWAGHHKHHHKFSDKPGDVHSPRDGFWWSHMGWISSPLHSRTRLEEFKDHPPSPQLLWLDKYDWVGPWALGATCFFAVGLLHAHAGLGAFIVNGLAGLMIVFFASTLMLWHGTFIVNSLTHKPGVKQRFRQAKDDSRDSLRYSLLTGGEGWHNNHHRYMNSAKIGFYWWQIDTGYYMLKLLSWIGIVKDLKVVPERIKEEGRRRSVKQAA